MWLQAFCGRFWVATRWLTARKGCGGKRKTAGHRGGCNPEKFFYQFFALYVLPEMLCRL